MLGQNLDEKGLVTLIAKVNMDPNAGMNFE